LKSLELLFGFREGTTITIRMFSENEQISNICSRQTWICDNVIPVILPFLRRYKTVGYPFRVEVVGGFAFEEEEVFILGDDVFSNSWKAAFEQVSTRPES
jgi:hypothetical protein